MPALTRRRDHVTTQRPTAAEWQAAMEALILVATHGGPTMLARIGVVRAMNRHHVREFNSDRKPHHWSRRRGRRPRPHLSTQPAN